MNKIKYLIVALFTVGLVHGQDELNLPNYTPPSPEASAMTRYADLQANEFRGMVSHTIPLHTYKAGQLELPISISYNGAGVRVDDIPTWVGMNWTINAGGVITRTVKDIADESTGVDKRRMLSDAEITFYNANSFDGTNEGNFIWNTFNNSQYDSEVDIFQFNFNGYSGSFYLDENWNAKLLRDDQNMKIDIGSQTDLLNNKLIKITTSDGVKYTFGGNSATEETTLRNVINGGIEEATYEGVTAYYLTKIEHPVHGEINFQYESLSMENLLVQKTQKQSRVILYNDLGDCPGGPACSNEEDYENITSSLITSSSRIISPKYLSSISSPHTGETVVFNSETVDNSSFKRVLNSIIIDRDGDGTNQPFKTIDFEYLGFSPNPHPVATTRYAQKRFFLTKILFDKDVNYAVNTQDGRRNQVYEFDYDSPTALPNRFDYAQDFAGYYNGKSNSTSIPDHPTFNPNGIAIVADRNPDFNYAQMGTLKKITYPTGGYTEIEYEAATKAKKKNYKGVSLHSWRNMNQYGFSPNNKDDGIPQVDINGNYIGIENVYENQSIVINVVLKAHREQGDVILNQNERATLYITSINPANGNELVTSHLLTMNSDTSGTTQAGVVEKSFTINSGLSQGFDYELDLVIEPTTSGDPIGMEALLSLSYYDGFSVVEDLGVRLKKMTDFAQDGQAENIKRYYYSTIDNVNAPVDLETLPIQGEGGGYIKTDKHISNKICIASEFCSLGAGGAVEIWYQYLNLYSNKVSYGTASFLNFYENVTISFGGDNFEKGGVEKTFSKFSDLGAFEIKTYSSGIEVSTTASLIDANSEFVNKYTGTASVFNGVLLKENYFKKENSSIKKIRQVDFNYIYTVTDRVNSLIAKQEFNPIFFEPGEDMSNVVSNYSVGYYLTESKNSKLIQKQIIEYIDPVPLGVTDESSYDKIVSVEDYQYGDLAGLPTEITTTSSDGQVNTNKRYYVNDVSALTGLSADNLNAYAYLNAINQVEKPIQVETYKSGSLTSQIRTLYKAWSVEEPSHVFPESILSTKGDLSLRKRVVFHEYDSAGRPTLVSKANGTKTRYWYNGLGQLIMKADNFVTGAGGLITSVGVEQEINTDPCAYLNGFSSEVQIFMYKYDPATHLLIEIIDSKCNSIHYIYDDLHRLQMIKDKDGNILQEFDLSFKRY